mmetsp:Transcript_60997/g.120076  ORF Transcript_60997/g.120076 Transcript_60997/m.120076 type:complete len:215 (+) Transcript_60997:42-686(+)
MFCGTITVSQKSSASGSTCCTSPLPQPHNILISATVNPRFRSGPTMQAAGGQSTTSIQQPPALDSFFLVDPFFPMHLGTESWSSSYTVSPMSSPECAPQVLALPASPHKYPGSCLSMNFMKLRKAPARAMVSPKIARRGSLGCWRISDSWTPGSSSTFASSSRRSRMPCQSTTTASSPSLSTPTTLKFLFSEFSTIVPLVHCSAQRNSISSPGS